MFASTKKKIGFWARANGMDICHSTGYSWPERHVSLQDKHEAPESRAWCLTDTFWQRKKSCTLKLSPRARCKKSISLATPCTAAAACAFGVIQVGVDVIFCIFVISYRLPILFNTFIVCASLSSQAQVIVMHVLHCSAWQYLYTFRLGTWMTSFMQPILWVFLLWAAIRVADFQSWTWRETKWQLLLQAIPRLLYTIYILYIYGCIELLVNRVHGFKLYRIDVNVKSGTVQHSQARLFSQCELHTGLPLAVYNGLRILRRNFNKQMATLRCLSHCYT